MRHPAPDHSPALLALALVLVALLASLPVASPTRAQTLVAADPPGLAVSLPLGAHVTQPIRLSASGGAFAPAVYEAQAPAQKSLASGPKQARLPAQAERLDARIAKSAAAANDGRSTFLVVLQNQADLSAAYSMHNWAERGRFVYRTLFEHAERSQAELRTALAARGLAYRPLWVVNAIEVRGSVADAVALAGRADVAVLRAERVAAMAPDASLPAVIEDRCSPDVPGNPVCWNIRRIGADRVWHEFGVDGAGVTVANIDTGVAFTHQALAAGYRGNHDGVIDHNYNWYDPQGNDPAPIDTNGHGSHTMATIAGRGAGVASWPAVGVAPGARWITAQGCSGFVCSEYDLIAAAQWMLAPTDLAGRNPRPDLRPMIVNNSWGGIGGNDWYAPYTAAWRAAGIFPVFAAGNADSSRTQACGTIASPGDYPDVVQVGATDAADQITSFSLLGPTTDGRIKPDFAAPGTHTTGQLGIYSAAVDAAAGYRTLSGTSMAAPHVAGVVALLWAANPALIGDYDATYAMLRTSARPLSDTRCGNAPGAANSVYGNGRVDAYAAVARARVDVAWLVLDAAAPAVATDGSAVINVTLDADRVPGPGVYTAQIQVFGADLGETPTTIAVALTVTPIAGAAVVRGRVLDAESRAPLQATVGVQNGLGAATDADGSYILTLAPGERTLVASALSYLAGATPVTLGPGTISTIDIVLAPDQPRAVVTGAPLAATLGFGEERVVPITISNTGQRPLIYGAAPPLTQYAVWRSDSGERGAPAYHWVDLPEDAARLKLAADDFTEQVPLGLEFPFYSYVLTETLVTSDGTLTFDTPYGYAGPSTRCLPADELGFYIIAPLRADLDPSRGGTVRYGTVDGGSTFVVSYENIPRDDGPLDQTYTFQALLHADGRLVFQYKSLAPRTSAMSVGLQRTPWEYQEIGCGGDLPVHNGLALELRPQPSSATWLSVEPSSGMIAPGASATVQVTLAWARPTTPGPFRASVQLASNDPRQPLVTLPVELATTPAPHEQALLYVFR